MTNRAGKYVKLRIALKEEKEELDDHDLREWLKQKHQESKKLFEEMKSSHSFISSSDVYGAFQDACLEGIWTYASEHRDAYQERYPHTRFFETYTKFSLLPSLSYDALDKEYSLVLGAAIWILDHLYMTERLHEVLRLLPRDISADVVDAPFIADSVFPQEMIYSMVDIIMHRYSNMHDRVFLTAANVSERHDYENAYGDILAMIDPQAIAHAEKTFIDLQEDYLATYFTEIEKMNVQYDERLEEVQSISADFWAKYDKEQLYYSREYDRDDFQGMLRPRFPMQAAFDDHEIHSDKALSSLMDVSNRLTDILDFEAKLPESASLAISDPYELCFALLNLLDHQHPAPLNYQAGVAVMNEAGQRLPWFYIGDGYYRLPPYTFTYANGELYSRDASGESVDDPIPVQMFFQQFGVIPERYHLSHDCVREIAARLHLPSYEGMSALVAYSELASFREDITALYFHDQRLVDSREKQTEKQLREELRKLKEENKKLRNELHHMEKDVAVKQQELAIEKEKLQAERAAFKMSRETPTREEVIVEDLVFPYEVKSRIIVYGGHEQWLKNIRDMFTGNIRFINADVHPNGEQMRNADAIFMQTNHMSHSSYHALMNIVKSYHIPVVYFTTAGTRNCARQLVHYDQENYHGKEETEEKESTTEE